MPMYEFKCEVCGRTADVLRKFDDQFEPTYEEGGVCDHDERHGAASHKWTKVIHPCRVTKGSGWRGGKGSWVLAALCIGAGLLLNGCEVSADRIAEAQRVCAANGGVDHLYVKVAGYIVCKNGARFQ